MTRSADGRWLAGRRAPWLASWAGRWALGAGGAVDLNEIPADTLVRELDEEWSVTPERVRGEALVRLPQKLVMFIGQAWLPMAPRWCPTTSTTPLTGGPPLSTTGRPRPATGCDV